MTSEVLMDSEELDMIQNTLADTADAAVAAVENAAHHYGAFYENPEFWVGVAFVLVVILLARPVSRMVRTMLEKRIDGIARRINDAQKLKDDAQKLWIEYEKKFLNAPNEAYEILKKSENEMEQLKDERIRRLEEEIKARENDAQNRIATAEQEAVREIRICGSELSIRAVKKILAEKLDETAQDQLIDRSIELLKKAE